MPRETAERGALYAAEWRKGAAVRVHALDRADSTGTRNAHQTMRHAAARCLHMAPAATGEDEPS
jgi:hypothetical protein